MKGEHGANEAGSAAKLPPSLDIVERLRVNAGMLTGEYDCTSRDMREAADEINQLKANLDLCRTEADALRERVASIDDANAELRTEIERLRMREVIFDRHEKNLREMDAAYLEQRKEIERLRGALSLFTPVSEAVWDGEFWRKPVKDDGRVPGCTCAIHISGPDRLAVTVPDPACPIPGHAEPDTLTPEFFAQDMSEAYWQGYAKAIEDAGRVADKNGSHVTAAIIRTLKD